MRISEKRHSKLYSAIADPVMNLRIEVNNGKVSDLDKRLHDLELEIYNKIAIELNLTK